MQKMKDSGTPWIGHIPEDWAFDRLKYHAKLNPAVDMTAKVFGEEDEVSFIPMENLKNGYHKLSQIAYGKVRSGYTIFENGDILIAKVTPCFENGNLAIAQNLWCGVGFGSTEISVVRCSESMNSKYLFYFFQNPKFIEKGVSEMYGVAGLKRLPSSFLIESKYPIPPADVQFAIAQYLDDKCGQIDAVIAAKEKTNESLKAYRQSVIYEAVTKGLDPAAPLKDTNIPWLGKIPVAWTTRKLKHLVQTKITDGPHSTPDLLDDGVPFVSAESIKDNKVNLALKRGYISREDHLLFCQKCRPRRGDIFMVKSGATTGAIVDFDEEFSIWSPLALIRCREDRFSQKFIFYAMQSDSFRKQVEVSWSFGTQQNIGMGVIENLFVATPEKAEQENLVAYLDDKCGQIDAVIAANESTVKKLLEYRQSLIYEAVTGKIACD